MLSVNGTNVEHARGWHERFPASKSSPSPTRRPTSTAWTRTVETLAGWGVPFRIDPILEPIGFGFAASLGRYLEVRRRYPDAEMMMGVGNLTELTDVDSAGVNVLLAGLLPGARHPQRADDGGHQLVPHRRCGSSTWPGGWSTTPSRERVLPKHLEPDLVMLRDPKLLRARRGRPCASWPRDVTDRNYRLFAERGEIARHQRRRCTCAAPTRSRCSRRCSERDPKLDPSHAFYLGYEMAKAVTALTLGKNYTQDQALRWGFLTVPEMSHRGRADDAG